MRVAKLFSLLGIAGLCVLQPGLVVGQEDSTVLVAQGEELAEAEKLDEQVNLLYQEGKYDEAIPLAEKVLAIHKRILGEEHSDVAHSLNSLALLYQSQGRYEEAEPYYLQALEMRKRLLGEEHPYVATSLNNLALLYENQGRYGEAESYHLQALEMRKRLLGEEHPYVANSLSNLALPYQSQGRYEEAESYHLQSLEMYKRLLGEEHPSVATSLNNLALLYQSQGRYEEAESYHLQALEMKKLLLGEEHPYVATSLNNLASLYQSQGRYGEAEPYHLQALEMRKLLLGEEHPDMADSLDNLALLYQSQGRYGEAEPYHLQALEMRKLLLGEENPYVAISLSNLASLYQSQGRYGEAESYNLQALEMYKRLLGGENPYVANSLNNLASLYQSQGRYGEAETYHLQALEMRKHMLGEEHPSVANSLSNLASMYQSQGRYGEAESYNLQALEMRKHMLGEEHPSVANSLNNLALLYQSQGRYGEAEPYHLQALEMYKRLLGEEHPYVATILSNLASLYQSQGRYGDAETYHLQSLEMLKRLLGEEHPSVATSLNNLALLYQSQGRYGDAETYHLQSLEMLKRLLGEEHHSVATILSNLASLYQSQGRYGEVEPYLLQALEMRKRLLVEEHHSVATSLNKLALLHWSQDNTSSAIEKFTQALRIEDSNLTYNLFNGFERQKRDYLKKFATTIDNQISLHLNTAPSNPKATNLALTTILQRKGRILDFFTNSLQILRQHLEPENQQLLNGLTTTYSQLANLIYNRPEEIPLEQYRARVAELDEQVKQLERELSSRSQEFRQEFQTTNIESIQKLIPADAALLELVQYRPYNPKTAQYGEPRYAAYILPSQGEPIGMDLGTAQEIDFAVEVFRSTLSSDPRATPIKEVKKAARNLETLITEPIRKYLGNTRNILISSDSQLNLVPFEALVDENNQYLVENYSFTYFTSGRDLLRLQNQSPSQQQPLIMGDPNFKKPGEEITLETNTRTFNLSNRLTTRLKGTKDEAEAIATKLGVTALTDTQATEQRVKQINGPRILHIATHGFFANAKRSPENQATIQDNPLLLSGLVLAGFKVSDSGTQEDGILTAQETTLLDLVGTKLVVLSACDTGIGSISDNGQGLYGLRRALVMAGSESQVMSLWKVEDNATKDLMISYYDKILANEGRSEALRQTQLEMLNSEEYSHPYYWAAFIPSGDWRPIDR